MIKFHRQKARLHRGLELQKLCARVRVGLYIRKITSTRRLFLVNQRADLSEIVMVDFNDSVTLLRFLAPNLYDIKGREVWFRFHVRHYSKIYDFRILSPIL